MDVFSRSFLPAAAEARVPTLSLNRHMSILRRCVESGDAPVLVTRCIRPERPAQGEYLLLLTYRRLVVTQQSRLLHRLRLHLNHDLRHLSNVTWNPDLGLPGVELAATAIDGIRERFLIRATNVGQMWQFDGLLGHVFRPRAAAGTPDPAGARFGTVSARFGAVGARLGTVGTAGTRFGTVGAVGAPLAPPAPRELGVPVPG